VDEQEAMQPLSPERRASLTELIREGESRATRPNDASAAGDHKAEDVR
jgi:hypothetical protein